MKSLKIASDFSFVPAGRYLSDGQFSGERFREEVLKPLFLQHNIVEIDIDGTAGYGSSFLEEAFGGLVRKGGFTSQDLHKRLKIVSSDPSSKAYEVSIWRFIDSARKE